MTLVAPKGAVAAGHDVTARAAIDMLQKGGNAFDATLAALFASCVCEPVLSSLGGGGFLMAHEAESPRTTLFDFFVQTPREKRSAEDIEFDPIYADFGTTQQKFLIGMGSSATPGFVSGCFDVHNALCTLPIETIVEPAIKAARLGVVMTAFNARLFNIVGPILLFSAGTRKNFAPNGDLLGEGEIYKNPELAETLTTLAIDGSDFFYKGSVCEEIMALTQNLGGHLSPADLSSYKTEKRRPLVQPFGGSGEVFLNPPPSSGGCLIGFGLALAEQIDPGGDHFAPHMVARILQATDHTRQQIFDDPGMALRDSNIAKALASIKTQTITTKGTTHISVIDAAGNAAAATVSNGEGNGHMIGDYGFMLNNMLGEEDLSPQGFHQWAHDVRLSSMMAPTYVRDRNGTLSVLGSGGANRIRSAMLQTLLRIKAGQDPHSAINAARLHFEDGKMDIENWINEKNLAPVLADFPNACLWDEANMFFGGVHIAQRDVAGNFDGLGDPRRDGCFLIAE